MPGGSGHVTLTGQLGSVMQESARAALSHIRQHATELGIPQEFLTKQDLHVHVPAGAIPKDGPSAGVTMATAIVSAARGIPVDPEVAMTGEITLSGLVLPVGGIREKALAARRHGIRTFILPQLNELDVEELPEEVRREMSFVPVSTLRRRAERWRSRRPHQLKILPFLGGLAFLHFRPRIRPRHPSDRDRQRARRARAVDAHRHPHLRATLAVRAHRAATRLDARRRRSGHRRDTAG